MRKKVTLNVKQLSFFLAQENQNAGLQMGDDIVMEIVDIASSILMALGETRVPAYNEHFNFGPARITVELLGEEDE